jgi:transglutaminase-like putative cysteine protease
MTGNKSSKKVLSLMIAAAAAIAVCFAVPYNAYAKDTTYHETEIEASSELKESMKERKGTATIGIKGKTDQEGLQQIIGRVIGEATEHTGEPDEGDYILFQYASYKGQARTEIAGVSPVVEIEYDLSYYDDAEQEAEVDTKVTEILEELDLENKMDYEKVSAIHDYICSNVEYEAAVDGSDIRRTAYGALIEGRAVCQGYSVSLYRLLLEAGIDNRIIFGEGLSPDGTTGPHTWNIVELYGKYYYMDITWDDSTGKQDFFLVPAGAGFEDEHRADDKYREESFTERYPMADEAFDTKIEGLLAGLEGLASSITDSMIQFFRSGE